MKDFFLTTPDRIKIKQLANMTTNPIIYCNLLFAKNLVQPIISIDGDQDIIDYPENYGYIGKYKGIPVYVADTLPIDQPYAVILPQFIKEN